MMPNNPARQLPLMGFAALLFSPVLAKAQTADSKPPSRWYVEAAAAYQTFPLPETIWAEQPNSMFTVLPAQLRVGYTFRNGKAFETGLLVRYREKPVAFYKDYSHARVHQSSRNVRTVAIPMLFYTPFKSNKPNSRAEFGTKFGATLIVTNYLKQEYSTSPRETTPYNFTEEESKGWGDLPLTFGGYAGYRLNDHLKLTADVNANVSYLLIFALMFGSEVVPLGGGASLGIRYTL